MNSKRFGILIVVSLLMVGCGSDPIINPNKQLDIDVLAIDQYLEDNDITDAVEHTSGLRYRILSLGTGTKPQLYHYIRVKYKGTLMSDGSVFDETPAGKSYSTFVLSATVQGWQIGLPLIPEGSSAVLYIPSSLAYGKYPREGIPANSNLIFEIDLIDVIE